MSTEETTVATATEKPKVSISIAGVLQDLANGLDRKEIGKKYGLNNAQTTLLFKNPKLRGRKVKRDVDVMFEVVDDAPDAKPVVIKERTAEEKEAIAAKAKATRESNAAKKGTVTKTTVAAPAIAAAAAENTAPANDAPEDKW